METLVKDVLALYGPLAIGWVVALFLGWRVVQEQGKPNVSLQLYQDMAHEYHVAIMENTRVLERLATLLEERTSRQRRAP